MELGNIYKSSHWEYHSKLGTGFGDMRKVSVSEQAQSFICFILQWLSLPDKVSIIHIAWKAIKLCRILKFGFTFDVFKHVFALSAVMPYLQEAKHYTFLNIGDGYGFMACLLKSIFPDSMIAGVDLAEILPYQIGSTNKAFPCGNFVYCTPERLKEMGIYEFDLTFNITSFQEMTPAMISIYFEFLRSHTSMLYCCNRVSKQLRGGEVINFDEYPYSLSDVHLIDEVCRWYRYFIERFRIRHFDGEVKHRLSVLSAVLS